MCKVQCVTTRKLLTKGEGAQASSSPKFSAFPEFPFRGKRGQTKMDNDFLLVMAFPRKHEDIQSTVRKTYPPFGGAYLRHYNNGTMYCIFCQLHHEEHKMYIQNYALAQDHFYTTDSYDPTAHTLHEEALKKRVRITRLGKIYIDCNINFWWW